jgi:predicted GNAT family acetyltransferase
MTDLAITKQTLDNRHGRYVARIAGIDAEGEITFTNRSPDVISADHTGVPEAMNGRGVAKALLGYMLDDARKSGFRIVPICPFIFAQYARHPEWRALFTSEPGKKPKLGP